MIKIKISKQLQWTIWIVLITITTTAMFWLVQPVKSASIFTDDFESGNLTAWDSSSGEDISASTASKKNGTYGMQVTDLTDATSDYVQDNLNNTEVYVRVYIDPNSATLRTAWNADIAFLQLSDAGTQEYVLEVGIKANATSGYDIRMIGQNDISSWDVSSDYYNITDDWHLIEMRWKAGTGADGVATLWIDEVQKYTLTGRDTNSYTVDRIRLGTVRNLSSSDTGTLYWDDYASDDSSYIGPPVPTSTPTNTPTPTITPTPSPTPATPIYLTTGASTIQIDVPNRYRAIMQTGDTTDYLLIYDRAQSDSSPSNTYEFMGPYIYEAAAEYMLRYHNTRKTTILESSSVRVRIRVEGCFDTVAGGACLGTTDFTVIEDYTFTTEGIYVSNITDFNTGGVALDTPGTNENGYNFLMVDGDIPADDNAFADTLYYGDGVSAGNTAIDATLAKTNTYATFPAVDASGYQSAIIGIPKAGWFDQSGGTGDWRIDVGYSGTIDRLHAREGNVTPTSLHYAKWYFLLQPENDLDAEGERESFNNDNYNPDILTFNTGSKWGDYKSSANITTSAAALATANSFQRKTWHDGTRYWAALHNDTDNRIEFWYSTDKAAWAENTSARLTGIDTNDFSVEADSTDAFIAYTNGFDVEARKAEELYASPYFVWGSATIVYNGTSSTDEYDYPAITKDSNNKLWITARHYGSASPYLYTYQNGKYEYFSDFLGGVTSKESERVDYVDITDRTEIVDNIIKLKITEELRETTYLDRVYLRVNEKEIIELSRLSGQNFCPDSSLLSSSDNQYFVLNQGDEYYLEFTISEDYDKLEFAAEGYYLEPASNEMTRNEIDILNVHSHPKVGEDWTVEFKTANRADLLIMPQDQATIDDLDFVFLKCGNQEKTPQILENDLVFYPDWECPETGRLKHLVNVAGKHSLKFQFENQIAYAYNNPDVVTYYFNSYAAGAEEWEGNPSNMDDGNTGVYAWSYTNGRVELLNGNDCPGTDLGTISKVELRVYGYVSGGGTDDDITLRPVFGGTTDGTGSYVYNAPTTGAWSGYFDITSDASAPGSWSWSDVQNLDVDVVHTQVNTLDYVLASKVEIQVTYSTADYMFKAIQSSGANNISAWGTAVKIDAGSANANKYGTIVPLNSGDMYAAWIDGTAIQGCFYDEQTSDRWEDSLGNDCTNGVNQDSIDTGVTGLAKNLSAVVDSTNNDVHLLYIEDDTTDTVSYARWDNGSGTNGAWQTEISLDSSDNDAYVSLSLESGANDLYAFWMDTSTNDIFYRYCDVSGAGSECSATGDWTTEVGWFNTTSGTSLTANYSGSSKNFAIWTEGSANPYTISFADVSTDEFNETEGVYTLDFASNQAQFDIDGGSNASTTANGVVTTGSSTVTVTSTTGFDASGTAYIEGDRFTYTGTTATTFTGVPTSGEDSVIGHASGAVVSQMNRHKPFFKMRQWQSNTKPSYITLEGLSLTENTNYYIDYKPVSDAYFADELTWYSTFESASAFTSPDVGTGGATSTETYVAAKYGKGVYFDAAEEIYFTINGDLNTSKGALEFWYKPDSNHNDSAQKKILQALKTGGGGYFSLFKQADNSLRFEIYDGTTYFTTSVTSANYSWSAGDWVHLKIDWDETAAVADQMRIYVNGVEPTHTDDTDDYSDNSLTLNTFYISDNSSVHADGVIDELRIYGGEQDNPDKIAQGGDTADSSEYLFDSTNDYTLDLAQLDAKNRGEYVHFGSDSMFSGINVDLQTNGVSGSATAGLFNINHEGGNLEEYDTVTNPDSDLSVSSSAALAGTNYGLSCLIDDTTVILGRKNQTGPVSGKIRARFYIHPNSVSMDSGENMTVMQIQANAAPWYAAGVLLKHDGTNYEISAFIGEDGGGNTGTSNYDISNAAHYIEIYLVKGAGNASLTLWIDGVQKEVISSKDNDSVFDAISSVDLGMIWTGSTVSGTYYLDELKVNDTGTEIGAWAAEPVNLDWEYWNGTSWADLESISGFTDGTSQLTQDGAVYWSANPTNWRPYSVNGSTDLYYIRASINKTAGSFTTSPVENTIKTDIITLQYLSNITTDNQTFLIQVAAPTPTFPPGPFHLQGVKLEGIKID